jgi:hypothetical protein
MDAAFSEGRKKSQMHRLKKRLPDLMTRLRDIKRKRASIWIQKEKAQKITRKGSQIKTVRSKMPSKMLNSEETQDS